MKLHAAPLSTLNTVTAYGPGFIEVNQERHGSHLLLTPESLAVWSVADFDALTADHFEALLEISPELVILGTGARQRFPHPRLTQGLMRAGIGVEAMDSAAACRTYNILMAEGRRVAAAVLVETVS
ncbi:MAG: Mth938-like domain-containing protein [Burkholderiaceae bacterium]